MCFIISILYFHVKFQKRPALQFEIKLFQITSFKLCWKVDFATLLLPKKKLKRSRNIFSTTVEIFGVGEMLQRVNPVKTFFQALWPESKKSRFNLHCSFQSSKDTKFSLEKYIQNCVIQHNIIDSSIC